MTAKANPIPFKETDSPDELRTGTKLLHGQYEITEYLNSGGFGITYLAKDSLDRQVVIKECFASAFCRRSDTVVSVRSRAHSAEFTSLVRLFVQEAKNLAKLKHPNIVGVHQIFEDNDTAYMALDFVDGRDLLDMIEDPNDRISPADVQTLTLKLLNAIGYIHSTGVLHRDISPDNILLERGTNNPVLIDFGAAREEATRQTRMLSAMRVVKDGYSPQEFYIQGSEQTPSSDLYAFGATLYHLITGDCPPDSQSRLAAIAGQKPDPFQGFKGGVEGYSEGFLNAIVKAMQIFPYDRLQSAKEWIDMIRPGPELVALPGGNRVTPRRVVSQRLEDAQAEARAEELANIPPPEVRPDEDIEVVRAENRERPQRTDRKPVDFLNVRTPEPPEKGGKALPAILGAVAACVVVGLGVVYFVPGVLPGAADAPAAPSASADTAGTPAPEAPAPVATATAGAETAPAPSLVVGTPRPVPPASAPADTRIVEKTAPETSAAPTLVLEPPKPASETGTRVVETTAPQTTAPQTTARQTAAPAAPAASAADPRVIETTAAQPPAAETAVAEPAVPLAVPEMPLTTAPSLGESGGFSESTPHVLATVDPKAAAAGSHALAPASKDIVTAGLPTVDFRPASQPVEADGDVQEATAVMSRWTVGLPFAASSGGSNVVGAVQPDAPAWVKRGTRILRVEGRDVASLAAIPDAVRHSTTISGKTDVKVEIAYAEPGSKTVQTTFADLPAVLNVALLNGMQFRTAFRDGAWVTSVVESTDSGPNGLRTGDALIAYIPTSEKINGPSTLADIFAREVGKGTSRFAFAVSRGGELWVASLEYNASKN